MLLPLLLGLGCGRGSPQGEIAILLPAGAAPSVSLRAVPIADLAPLRRLDGGEDVVAAASFEPSGTVLPEGTRIRWPLSPPRTPGESLYVVALAESEGRWVATGDLATVLSGGLGAEGVVRHFSTIGLSAKRPAARGAEGRAGGGAPPARAGKEPEEGVPAAPRPATPVGSVVHLMRGKATVVAQAKMDAVRGIYDAWRKDAGPGARLDRATMRRIYAAGDFATVKAVIENGGIEARHSLEMADLRSAMILEVLIEIGREKGWRIVRSDSGNQSSGMKSDIDQTVYVYEPSGRGGWKRHEAGDAELLRLFAERFPARTGFSLESLDVATIAARDNFPDPRRTSVQIDAEGLRPFAAHTAESMVALRLTPGAYTYCGAVVQQMQLRADAAIEKMLRGAGDRPNPPRDCHPDLAKHLGENGVNNLVCLEILPDGTGGGGVHELSQEGARAVIFDSLPPRLLAGHAYDAAVANYLEFVHHLSDHHPAVKYMLRALDDGLRTAHRFRAGEVLPEYASVPEGERRAHLEKLLGHDPALKAQLDRWKTAFDVSAALRDAHKGGNLTDADYAKAMRPLAEEIAQERGGAPEDHLDRARTEYDARCQEFLVANAIETATERVMEFATYDATDPSKRPRIVTEADEAKIRASLGLEAPDKTPVWDRVKGEIFRNEADLARLQLLYAFREMRPDVRARIIERAKAKGLSPVEVARIEGLAAESKTWYFGVKRLMDYPGLHFEYVKAVGRLSVRTTFARLHEAVLVQSGWLDTDAGVVRDPRVAAFLAKVRLGGADEGLRAFFAKHRAAGVTSRYVRNVVFDPGNYAGVLQVVRTYCETGGDPDATAQAMVREAVSVLPIVGQVYALSEAETVTQAVTTGGVMVACILVPQAGVAALLFNVGEAGVAIYEAEYARPLADTVADALYRGWVGPPLRSFERAPAEFTANDAKALASAEAGAREWAGATDPQGQRRYLDVSSRVRILRAKRAAWESYDTERRRAPAWEKMGILSQRGLACPTLLEGVEPVIFYGPPDAEGPVDFTVKPLSSDEEGRRQELDARRRAPKVDGVAWEDDIDEYGTLETRRLAAERAARYLAEARRNRELMHQIRVDSLWPWISQHAANSSMVDSRSFASEFCERHRKALLEELALQGVLARGAEALPTVAVEELGNRLLDDVTRSRELWNLHRAVVEAQRKAEQDRVEHRKGAWYGEALAEAARRHVAVLSEGVRTTLASLGLVPDEAASLSPLARAIEERHLPEARVDVEISLRKVPRPREDQPEGPGEAGGTGSSTGRPPGNGGGDGAKADGAPEAFDVRPDVKVTADPRVFRPPYHAAAFQLAPDAARAAAAAGSFQGLPLDGDAKAAIARYLEKVGPVPPDAKHVDPLVLVFAFCSAYERPSRVVPETLADLPDPPKVTIPGQGVPAYLLAGAAVVPPTDSVPEGEISMSAVQWPGLTFPVFEIRSAALGKLDAKRPDMSLRFWLLRSRSPDGPFEPIANQTPRQVLAGTTPQPADPTVGRPTAPGLVGPDRVQVYDPSPEGIAGGYHYVGVQRAYVGKSGDWAPKGEEQRSRPVGPGQPALAVFDAGGGTTPPRPPSMDTPVSFTVQATGSEIATLRQGVEIRVTDRYGERRYFTPRTEDGVRVGEADGSRGRASGHAYVPVRGGSYVVRCAEGGRPVTMDSGSNPDYVRMRDQTLADRKKSLEAQLAEDARLDEADRAALAQRKPSPGDAPAGARPDVRIDWASTLVGESDWRVERRMTVEYYRPRYRNEARYRVAMLSEDPRAAMVIARENVEVARRQRAIYAEEQPAYDRAVAAVADLDAGSTVGDIRRRRDALRSAEQEARLRGAEFDAWKRVLEAAWVAADAAAYTEALDAMLRLSDGPLEKERRLDALVDSAVARLVSLTGDRRRGAALLREALALRVEKASPADRDAAHRQFRVALPSWWPEGDLPPAPK